MKTIKELADELGLPKDKVKYQVGKLPDNCMDKSGNITRLTPDGVAIIKRLLVGNVSQPTSEEFTQLSNSIVAVLQSNIDTLHAQLETKDKQISDLTEMLNTSQKLQAGTLQKLLEAPADVVADPQATAPPSKPKIKPNVKKKTNWFIDNWYIILGAIIILIIFLAFNIEIPAGSPLHNIFN